MTNPTAALRSKSPAPAKAGVKDVTGALRSRRYRRRQNSNESKAGVTVTTSEMCALAARLGDGRANPGDLKLAERLIVALVDRLAADSAIEVV
jgi:hypothetical protein